MTFNKDSPGIFRLYNVSMLGHYLPFCKLGCVDIVFWFCNLADKSFLDSSRERRAFLSDNFVILEMVFGNLQVMFPLHEDILRVQNYVFDVFQVPHPLGVPLFRRGSFVMGFGFLPGSTKAIFP